MTTIRRRAAVLLSAGALALTGACSSSDDTTATTDGAASAGATPCAPTGDLTAAKALLACGERSILFVETDYASGTGIVVDHDDEQYVLTNLHVVDPFDAADVTLSDGTSLATLPVVGAEAATDIAVLGPVPGDEAAQLEPIPLAPSEVAKGDDVYAVGYPGTADPDSLDLTITSGLVSRLRELPAWDQTYVQTDAVVEQGQSGGPLFSDDGALVGITGLALDESFSLALATADVTAAMDRILGDGGDDLLLVPPSADDDPAGGATSGTIEVADDLESSVLALPASSEDRVWNLSVSGPTGRFGVGVYDGVSGEVLAQSAQGDVLLEELLAAEAARVGMSVEEYAGIAEPLDPEVAARETAPGTFRIDVPADVPVEVELFVAPDAAPTSLQWTSDLAMWPLVLAAPPTAIEVGQQVETVMSGYQLTASFDVELTEGQELQLLASSPQGYVDLVVAEPGRTVTSADLNLDEDADGLTFFAESGGGLYDVDVDEPYTAPATGRYRIVLENLAGFTIATRLELREPGEEPAAS